MASSDGTRVTRCESPDRCPDRPVAPSHCAGSRDAAMYRDYFEKSNGSAFGKFLGTESAQGAKTVKKRFNSRLPPRRSKERTRGEGGRESILSTACGRLKSRLLQPRSRLAVYLVFICPQNVNVGFFYQESSGARLAFCVAIAVACLPPSFSSDCHRLNSARAAC